MPTVEVIPGLVLDDALYEAAAAGIVNCAPEFAPLSFERFTAASSWWMIPDDDCNGYKAVLEFCNDPERTVWLHDWLLPDLRGGEESRPHSHPWQFASTILTGGYTEDRYERTGDLATDEPSVREQLGVEHRAGSVNDVPRSVYHEVTEIHEPGRTLTLMVCGRGEKAAWGYLDTRSGVHTPTAPDPDFKTKLRHLNPHQY